MAPKVNDHLLYHSKKYGRMFPVPEANIKFNKETKKTELTTVAFVIVVSKNGAFEICSKNNLQIFAKKSLTKKKTRSKVKLIT